jgi:hypothetical protein
MDDKFDPLHANSRPAQIIPGDFLLGPMVDQYANGFPQRDLARHLAINPADGVQLARPIRRVVRPAQPSGFMLFPFCWHREAECGWISFRFQEVFCHKIVRSIRCSTQLSIAVLIVMSTISACFDVGLLKLDVGKRPRLRIVSADKFEFNLMARTERIKVLNREDVSEMPEWMKEKRCPHKKKYMSGQRIMPKNLTGKEKLEDLVDNVFLAYNSARLKEGCQLFADKMLGADVTIGRLDCLDRRQSVPRHAFCP